MFLSGFSYANTNLNRMDDCFVVDEDVGCSFEYNCILSANEVLQVGEFKLVTVYVVVESYELIKLSILDINRRGINAGFNYRTPFPMNEIKTNPIRAASYTKPLHLTNPISLRGKVNSFNKFETQIT